MTASASGKAPRQSRTRKPAATAPDAVAVSTQPKAAPAKARTRKPAVQAEAAVIPAKSAVVDLRTPADLDAEIAFTAYLLWEQGAPGDADSHWYTAEALVRS